MNEEPCKYTHGQITVEVPLNWRLINTEIWVTAFGAGVKYILDNVIYYKETEKFLLVYKQYED